MNIHIFINVCGLMTMSGNVYENYVTSYDVIGREVWIVCSHWDSTDWHYNFPSAFRNMVQISELRLLSATLFSC